VPPPHPPRLLGPAEIRALAAELDVRPTKTLGQNFVHDANTVRRIVAASGIGADDIVLEVGPGLGSLTLALLAEAGRVVAVEIDRKLAARLPQTIAEFSPDQAGNFDVVTADALAVMPDDLPQTPTALVANLPYNVAVPVLLHLMAEFPTIRTALVMVQAEGFLRTADIDPSIRGERLDVADFVRLAQARKDAGIDTGASR